MIHKNIIPTLDSSTFCSLTIWLKLDFISFSGMSRIRFGLINSKSNSLSSYSFVINTESSVGTYSAGYAGNVNLDLLSSWTDPYCPWTGYGPLGDISSLLYYFKLSWYIELCNYDRNYLYFFVLELPCYLNSFTTSLVQFYHNWNAFGI